MRVIINKLRYKKNKTIGRALANDTSTPIELKFYLYSFDLKEMEASVELYEVKLLSIELLLDSTAVK